MKKTFIIYCDWIDYMEDMSLEEKWLLFDNIMKYQNWQEISEIWWLKFVRNKIKKELDENNKKWEEIKEKRTIAGKNWGIAKASKWKQKLANASKWKQHLPVSDSVSVSDSETVSEINTSAKAEEENSLVEKEDLKEFWDHEINECLEIIWKYNNWVLDWTKGEQRIFSKNLIGKLKKIDSVLAWKFTRQSILEMILEIVSQDQYHSHKISWPKKIHFELASLMQICKKKMQEKKTIGVLPWI